MIRKGQKCEVEATQFAEGGSGGGASQRHSLSTFLIPPNNRDEMGVMLNSLGGFELGVELGVQRAMNSKIVLDAWKSCKKYYLVDLWQNRSTTRM
jgi:hypothetical protein